MAKQYEIRDPIHGFIVLDEWERDIVNHPVFQRLRRIRQLGLTDMVYPGAAHTRLEHSLGVMHVATKMFEAIVERRLDFLKETYRYDKQGIDRDKRVLKLAALLHDVGHAPLSHIGEELMPVIGEGKRYTHEHYSAAVVATLMKDVIESHPLNRDLGIEAQEVADLICEKPTDLSDVKPAAGRRLFWQGLVSGQLDADRADYLLRDSRHTGVVYGHYDLDRLLAKLTVVENTELGSPGLAVEEGGWHAAEGLIIARYMMFTQVYFHRVRRAYDHHLVGALRSLLKESNCSFPPPVEESNLKAFLEWDDWRVLGRISEGDGGGDGAIIRRREHDRCIFETPESPEFEDGQQLEAIRSELGDTISLVDRAEQSWYKFDSTEIWVLLDARQGQEEIKSLSQLSSVVRGLRAVNQRRIYVPAAEREKCQETANRIKRNWEST